MKYLSQPTPAPPPGIYRGIPAQEYHSWRAWNWSSMNKLTMAHVKVSMESKPEESGGASRLGSLVHELMLEPERFNSLEFVEVEKVFDRSSRGRAFDWNSDAEAWKWAAHEHAPLQPIPSGGLARLVSACEAYFTNPVSNTILTGTPRESKELSIVWKCPVFGYLMKARIDLITPSTMDAGLIKGEMIGDIKTTRQLPDYAFGRDAYWLNYHGQLAHYCEGWKCLTGDSLPCFWIVQYKDDDVEEVQVLSMPDQLLEMGQALRETTAEQIAENLVSGEWAGRKHFAECPIPASAMKLFESGQEMGGV